MRDICDGDYYNEHPLFKEDPTALQVCLYYDELETCNALGSKTEKHKLGICMCKHYGRYGDTILVYRCLLLHAWKR